MRKLRLNAFAIRLSLVVTCWMTASSVYAQPWHYIEVDDSRQKWGDWAEPEWLRYFGLDHGDMNGDGFDDIVSGRYVYLNPGASLDGQWKRQDLGLNTDGMLLIDADGDEFADVIATSLPKVYWLEATNLAATEWKSREIAQIKETGHVNGQGYRVADLIAGGKPEIILAGGGGLFLIEIPENPNATSKWKATKLFDSSDEGFGVADIDGDGDLDLSAADVVDGEPRRLFWWENPGNRIDTGTKHIIHDSEKPMDRICIADFNGDGRPDIAYSQERYPGKEPDARLVWLAAPSNPKSKKWSENVLTTQYSMNNLDVADVDEDGDIDIVTNEHKGPDLKLQLFFNDGKGNFKSEVIDRGKEMHLGAQFADIDNDGDLDIVGHAWDNYKYLHLWRNDRIKK